MRKIDFLRKQPSASNDYELAYNTVNDIEPGKSVEVNPENIPAFRKYAYDLAAKTQKDITTRKASSSLLIVYCLSKK